MNTVRTGRTGRATDGGRQRPYDAFISYSHAADSRLAPALERALRRLTRAWYQRQALRIFRDQTSLAANPDLYAGIERAMRNSRNFVLLASPAAARSPWVRREVQYWREHRERETFFIVVTDGFLRWDDAAGDFDWRVTNALPEEALRDWFPREPLWVNLGWTHGRNPDDLTLRHGRFRGDVATLAAALHGRSKEQIDSEDARQHRRALWLGRAIVAALALLLVLSVVQTFNASDQRDIAQQQRTVAEQQRALATQRALEALAQVDAATAPATSLDMSLAALRIDPTAQVRQTLVNTLLHTGYEGSSRPQTPGELAQTGAFSPDGRLFADTYTYTKASATSAVSVVSVWDTADPVRMSLVASLPSFAAKTQITSIAFSPDDRVLAVVAGDKAELWSPTATPRLLASITLTAAQAVAFSPSGTTLALVGGQSANGTLETWNIANPAAPRLLDRVGGVYYPQFAAFSPDGRTLVTGSGTENFSNNGTLTGRTRAVLWDVSDPQAPRQLSTIQVWDGEGGIAFGPGGTTLALTWSNEVSLWNIADPAQPRQLGVLIGDSQAIGAVAFSPDGRSLVTGGTEENRVLLWNIANPAHVPQPTLLAEDTAQVNALAFVHSGQSVLAADGDSQVSQWSVAARSPTLAATLTDPAKQSVLAVAVSPASRIVATTGYDQAVTLWNVTDPAHPVALTRIPTDGGNGSALAFSPDGTVLAVGSWADRLSLWDVRDPARPQLLANVTAPGTVSWLAFTPGGTTLAGGGDQYIQGFPTGFTPAWSDLWGTGDPRHPAVLHRFSNVNYDAAGALSPDGKTLVLPSFFNGNLGQSPVQVWNISNPAAPVELPNPDTTSPLTPQPDSFSNLSDGLTFAPVSGLAATASDATPPETVLWSYNGHGTASQISAVTGPDDHINSLAFDPSGHLLAAASDDFTTTVWDVADTAQPFTVQTITGDTGAVNDAVFSPDDRLLVTGSSDGTTEVWRLNALPAVAANPVGLACQLTGGGFTRSQWAQNVPGIPYSASCS